MPAFLRGEAFLVPGTAERPQKAAEGQPSQAITGGPAASGTENRHVVKVSPC